MFCPNCGKEILDNSTYCNKCGTKISNNEITSIINENVEDSTKKYNVLKIKKAIIGLIVLIVICGSGFCGYKYVQDKNFNDLVKSANMKLYTGNYDEAIQLYNKALICRNDSSVQKELEIAQGYKQYQSIYNEGLKLMNDKKYSEAIKKFSSINQSAAQIYNNAQGKISECKKNIINNNIQVANSNDAKQQILQTQKKENIKKQQQTEDNSIVIKYSIDEKGDIMNANYSNGSSIQLKVGQTISLIGNVSSKSSQRILFDGTIMKSLSPTVIKATNVGGGNLNIIPNGYDWDKAYRYHIIISN